MKGFECTLNGKEVDKTPCFFCKWRCKKYFNLCYDCIDNIDIAAHKLNKDIDFVHFEPISDAHLKALEEEYKMMKTKKEET